VMLGCYAILTLTGRAGEGINSSVSVYRDPACSPAPLTADAQLQPANVPSAN
jgi:hypothetical protein